MADINMSEADRTDLFETYRMTYGRRGEELLLGARVGNTEDGNAHHGDGSR